MLEDEASGVKNFTKNGECSGCGNCCTRILPISGKEIKRIKQYIEKHGIREQICCFPTAESIIDMQCPFRDDSGRRCTIYPVRPKICRDFRCDMPAEKIQANRDRYDRTYYPVDMRAVFFGRESVSAMMLREICDV